MELITSALRFVLEQQCTNGQGESINAGVIERKAIEYPINVGGTPSFIETTRYKTAANAESKQSFRWKLYCRHASQASLCIPSSLLLPPVVARDATAADREMEIALGSTQMGQQTRLKRQEKARPLAGRRCVREAL